MKPLLRRWLGACILSALVLPCAAIFFLGATQAQPGRGPFRPPNIPRPNFPGNPLNPNNPIGPKFPKIESVWKCSRCGAIVGRGNFPPATCPSCGARLINGVGQPGNNVNNPGMNNRPGNNMPNQPPVNQGNTPNPNNPPVNQDPQPPVNIVNQPTAGNSSASTPSADNDDSSLVPIILGAVAGGALLLALGVFVAIKMMGQIGEDNDGYEGRRRRRRRLEY